MKKYSLFFVISVLIITVLGCNTLVKPDDLIGEKWVPISGYKDGEPSDEPACVPYDKGIEFKDVETVYVESGDKDFRYSLRKSDDGMEISFYNPNGELDIFKIIIENENNLAMIGFGDSKSFNCYFEREE